MININSNCLACCLNLALVFFVFIHKLEFQIIKKLRLAKTKEYFMKKELESFKYVLKKDLKKLYTD